MGATMRNYRRQDADTQHVIINVLYRVPCQLSCEAVTDKQKNIHNVISLSSFQLQKTVQYAYIVTENTEDCVDITKSI